MRIGNKQDQKSKTYIIILIDLFYDNCSNRVVKYCNVCILHFSPKKHNVLYRLIYL